MSMGAPVPEPLQKADEVSYFLRVHYATVLRLVETGALRAVRVGGQLRFRPEDIEQFLKERATS